MIQPAKKDLPFERAAVAHNIMSAFIRIRDVDAKMSLEEVLTLLLVAVRPGISASEVADELGISRASQGRITSRLTEHGDRGTPGLELIYGVETPGNRRRKELALTAKGRRLVDDTLNDILKGFDHDRPEQGE